MAPPSVGHLAGMKAALMVLQLVESMVDPKVASWAGQMALRWVGTKAAGMAEQMVSPTAAWRADCWAAL